MVVFTTERVAGQPIAVITFKGSPIEQVEEYKYLGIVFHWKQGTAWGGEAMIIAAKRASFAMQQRA